MEKDNKTRIKDQIRNLSFKNIMDFFRTHKDKRILATSSFGNFTGNFLQTFSASLRQIFYVEQAGLTNIQFGIIHIINDIINAFGGTITGYLIDKNIFKRKYSSWILLSSSGFVIFNLINYSAPAFLEGTSVKIICSIMLVLLGTLHSISYITKQCVFSALTIDTRERVIASWFSDFWENEGDQIAGIIFPIILVYLTNTLSTEAKAYFGTALVFAVIAVAGIVFVNRELRKYLPGDKHELYICPETGKIKKQHIPFKEMASSLLRNKSLIIASVAFFFNFARRTFSSQIPSFYYKYVIGDLRWLSVGAALGEVFSVPLKIATPAFVFALKDNKKIFMTGTFGLAAAQVMIAIFARNVWVFIIMRMISKFFFGIMGYATNNIFAEAVDYSEWKTGIRNPGLIMSMRGIMANYAQSSGVILRTYFFEKMGYRKGFTVTPEFKNKVLELYLWSSLLCVMAGVVMFFYPVDSHFMESIKSDIMQSRKEKQEEQEKLRKKPDADTEKE